MLVLNAERIRALAPLPRLIESLRQTFLAELTVPPRQVAEIPPVEGRLFVSMPAFRADGSGMLKFATVFPDNPQHGLPTIQAMIVAFSHTGTPVALLDGTVVTHLRTGAASALASTYLSRDDSSHLLVVGTGALAPVMAIAHCCVRPIKRVSVWGRRLERAVATADAIRGQLDPKVDVQACESLEQAAQKADIVSCATSSATPVLCGKWLKPGSFVDLVGSFSPTRRESDDTVVQRSRIFVDTLQGALTEGGDIVDPLNRGIIDRRRVEGSLEDLVRERVIGRRDAAEIIVFKSVGTAIEDVAACELITNAALADQRSSV